MFNAIDLKGVTKTFGPKTAVEALDLSVPQGALYGLIGPNGAGKTTAIRMIMSILFPDDGEISVLGKSSALEAKDRIGYLPEERGLYKKMKAGAFIEYIAQLKGMPGQGLRKKVREWLARLELDEVENKKCEELSKGMQQKVQFIATVIHQPELLILDEPFSGLDPVNMRLLRDLFLEEHRRGATIIFSTHVMHQAEQICDHIVMIDDGRKVIDDSLSGIRKRYNPQALIYEPLDEAFDVHALSRLDGIAEVESSNGHWQLSLADGAQLQQTMQAVLEAAPATRVEVKRPTLEDIFVQIAGRRTSSDEFAQSSAEVIR